MRIEFINQWRDAVDFYRRFSLINVDLSIVWVNVEYGCGYKAVYIVVLGVGLECIFLE